VTNESCTSDRKAMGPGPIGLAETRGDSNIVSDALLNKIHTQFANNMFLF